MNDRERRTPRNIFQKAAALSNLQKAEKGGSEAAAREARKAEDLLSEGIRDWGGFKGIRRWLERHEPDHPSPEDVKGVDWGFLEED